VARVVIDVTLKSEILDPQGQAVMRALQRQGLSQVNDVRQGKTFEINFDGPIDQITLKKVEELASEVLSNPVIENFTIRNVQEGA